LIASYQQQVQASAMVEKAVTPALVTLRPFDRGDFDWLISWLPTEADLVEWCAAFFRHPLTRAQLEPYLESARRPNTRVIFTAVADDGEPVGHVEISHIWPHLSSRLSRVLVAPDRRRRGIGGAIVRQALAFSFREHGVDRIDLGVSTDNVAAIGCYEKLGFSRVGLWPEAIAAGSSMIDVLWLTLTRRAWTSAGNAL
jgi:RimJ/RimL family protein N-acetyltransferase